jgi:hypothetical protein
LVILGGGFYCFGTIFNANPRSVLRNTVRGIYGTSGVVFTFADIDLLAILNPVIYVEQKCSCCGEKGGKKELNVREWECLFCGVIHDRDINASRNIIQVAGGQSETQTGRGGDVRLSSNVAISDEASTCSSLAQS